jgi:TonB family protein
MATAAETWDWLWTLGFNPMSTTTRTALRFSTALRRMALPCMVTIAWVAPGFSGDTSVTGVAGALPRPHDSAAVSIEIEAPTAAGDTAVRGAAAGAPQTDSTVQDSSSAITKMPELKNFVQAVYPPELIKRGVEGTVLMNLTVNDSGTVDSVAVEKGIHPLLDSSAVAAARQFRFTPAMADTARVAVLLQYAYRFSLQDVVQKTEKYVNFSGHILEKGTRAPVADAMVVINFIDTTSDTSLSVPFGVYRQKIGSFPGQYLEGDRLVTVTDSTGYFQFYSLPACSIEVSIPAPGYEEFRESDQIRPSEALEVTYRMRRVSYSEYEVTVYYKGSEEKEVSRRELSLQEVKKIPGFGGDAVKVVQAMPGVARPTFGSFQMVIRGAQTSSSKFLSTALRSRSFFTMGSNRPTTPMPWKKSTSTPAAGAAATEVRSAASSKSPAAKPRPTDGTAMRTAIFSTARLWSRDR